MWRDGVARPILESKEDGLRERKGLFYERGDLRNAQMLKKALFFCFFRNAVIDIYLIKQQDTHVYRRHFLKAHLSCGMCEAFFQTA